MLDNFVVALVQKGRLSLSKHEALVRARQSAFTIVHAGLSFSHELKTQASDTDKQSH